MFPYYLARGAERVIGVDISAQMARIAASKMHDQRVEVICGDVEEIPVERLCDCCVVYNAFPHFESPERLVERLSHWLKSGGRLTVAHGMSLDALRMHHKGRADSVSREMLTAEELSAVFAPYFDVDVAVSDDENLWSPAQKINNIKGCPCGSLFLMRKAPGGCCPGASQKSHDENRSCLFKEI